MRESAMLASEGLLRFSKAYLTDNFLVKRVKPFYIDINKVDASKYTGKVVAMQTHCYCFCISWMHYYKTR